MRLFTTDDILETVLKVKQRGLAYIISKVNPNPLARTRSTFDDEALTQSSWWIVPAVRARWNEKISGDPNRSYESYVVEKYLRGRTGLALLSLGSGVCSHELAFATHSEFESVRCVDIAATLLHQAAGVAQERGLTNMQFEVADIDTLVFGTDCYDAVLFHSALHHFRDVPSILSKIRTALRPDGLLIINDYVGPNRLQWLPAQLKESNRILRAELPATYRRRFGVDWLKTAVSGPGLLRMIVSDPSEAVDSEQIIPELQRHFTAMEECAVGGNLLALVLKDIAHNFLDNSSETQALLQRLFDLEDQFLQHTPSDILFGVYRKK